MSSTAKAIVAGIITIAQGVAAVINDGRITNAELLQLGLSLLIVFGVYAVPNSPYPPPWVSQPPRPPRG